MISPVPDGRASEAALQRRPFQIDLGSRVQDQDMSWQTELERPRLLLFAARKRTTGKLKHLYRWCGHAHGRADWVAGCFKFGLPFFDPELFVPMYLLVWAWWVLWLRLW